MNSSTSKPAAPGADFDPVKKPSHYCRGGIEARNVVDAWELGFYLGNALKYICRCGHKVGGDPAQDLRKAIQNLEFELESRRISTSGIPRRPKPETGQFFD